MTNPRIGVVGIPGKWSSESLADAVEARTGHRLLIDMSRAAVDLDRGRVLIDDLDLSTLDALVIKKISPNYSTNTLDRLEMLRVLSDGGLPIFSNPDRILRLINRLSCTVTLRGANIPMPPTRVTEDIERAIIIVREFGTAIVKPLYSTKARGMLKLSADTPEEDLRGELARYAAHNPVMYLQKKLKLPGQDLGIAFLGGDFVGTYARVGSGKSWNTTIHEGGHYEPYTASAELVDLARRAQQPFGLDFTTVDIAETDQGPVVFEVSAFGGFSGLRDALGVNMAERYTDYLLTRIQMLRT